MAVERQLQNKILLAACFMFRLSSAQWNQDVGQKMTDDVFVPNYLAPKYAHHKSELHHNNESPSLWEPYDLNNPNEFADPLRAPLDDTMDHNRVKRKAKKRRGSKSKRSRHHRTTSRASDSVRSGTDKPPKHQSKVKSYNNSEKAPIARAGKDTFRTPPEDQGFVEVPKDLYQTHLRPGVIFRIHLSEAIIKMQYRNYAEHKDESVIEADVEYLRLTRKLISDEISKFEDFRRLMGHFLNRTALVREHSCNTNYLVRGVPPTVWTDSEENMKRSCLFDSLYLDQMPYVVGEDRSLMAAVAPPVLHCDAATCTSVPYVDSMMFEEKLPMSNVRTVTRCQASCRARCKNDADCLKRCAERCLLP